MNQQPPTTLPTTPFWLNEPTILFNKTQITQIWPNNNMSNTEKLNAISRFVIIASLLGYLLTMNFKMLLICVVTLAVLAVLFHVQSNQNKDNAASTSSSSSSSSSSSYSSSQNKKQKEGFINQLLYNDLKPDYTSPNKTNPMMNVLLPEISYDPNRNEAAPSYNTAVEKEINMNTKESVVDTVFSEEKDKQREYLKKKLFSDLGDNYNFDFSMRNFYTNPNTTIPNDQGGFANFCFGDMVSAKEGNEFALGRHMPRLGGTYN
jgi:hypothetical protein